MDNIYIIDDSLFITQHKGVSYKQTIEKPGFQKDVIDHSCCKIILSYQDIKKFMQKLLTMQDESSKLDICVVDDNQYINNDIEYTMLYGSKIENIEIDFINNRLKLSIRYFTGVSIKEREVYSIIRKEKIKRLLDEL